MQNLDPFAILALMKGAEKSGDKKAIREAVAPGSYKDITVVAEITIPRLNVGEDYDQKIVAKAKPWNLLAVALSKLNGVTIESLTREALDIDGKKVTAIKSGAAKAIAAIKGPTEDVCKGKVTLPDGATVKIKRGAL